MGVSACATYDGFFYRKKVVAVVGGGDTALKKRFILPDLHRKYLIVRKPSYVHRRLCRRVMNHEKIEVLLNTMLSVCTVTME